MEQKSVMLFCLGKGQPKGIFSVFWNKNNDFFFSYPSITECSISQVDILSLFCSSCKHRVRSGHKPCRCGAEHRHNNAVGVTAPALGLCFRATSWRGGVGCHSGAFQESAGVTMVRGGYNADEPFAGRGRDSTPWRGQRSLEISG